MLKCSCGFWRFLLASVGLASAKHLVELQPHGPLLRREGGGTELLDREASRGLDCSNVFVKCRNIVSAYRAMRAIDSPGEDQAVLPGGWLYELEKHLEDGSPGAGVLQSFYKVLNEFDLGAGLRHGQVWTIQHAEAFYRCNGFEGSLEIHTTSTDHEPFHGRRDITFCGGDMVCKGSPGPSGPIGAAAATREVIGSNRSNSVGDMNASSFSETNSSTDGRHSASQAADSGPHWVRKLWGAGLRPPQPRLNPATAQYEAPGAAHASKDVNFASVTTGVINWQGEPTMATDQSAASSSSTQASPEHEVLYCFANSLTATAREAFLLAIAHIQEQVPCISFRAVYVWSDRNDCDEYPSILVQSESGGCWSHVGQVSGSDTAYLNQSQALNLDQGCGTKGLVVHQLLHALGVLHQVYRPDRDEVIQLVKGNMEAGRFEDSFQTVQDFASSAESGFDFLSVMMYGPFSFSSSDGLMVSRPRDIRAAGFMGQRMGLSELDVRMLGSLYGCPGNVTPSDSNARLSSVLQTAAVVGDASQISEEDTSFLGNCKDSNSSGFYDDDLLGYISCYDTRHRCSHPSLGHAIRTACPKTCHECVPKMWPAMSSTSMCVLCEELVAQAWQVR